MDSLHILVVDDDERLRDLLSNFLRRHGYLTSKARDAPEARQLLEGLRFDLVVLDVMMPGEDGISLCRSLRQTTEVPIILLTARGERDDRISGLEAGADDYLGKPFDPKELLLRIAAILRRVPEPSLHVEKGPTSIRLGRQVYDLPSATLSDGEKLTRLTTTEQQLMEQFIASPGKALSRGSLVAALGRPGNLSQERAVDVQITRLRRKIEDDPKQPKHLQTVRGEGYILLID